MDGVLHFVGHGLMDGNGAGMTLNRSLLLLLAVYAFHLLTVSLSGVAIPHHHLFLVSLHFEIALSHLSLAHFLVPQLSIPPLHHFSVAAEIRWRVLREMRMTQGRHLMALRLGRWLSIVLMLIWRALGQVGDGQTMPTRRLRVVLLV